jgi:hypothetical protein
MDMAYNYKQNNDDYSTFIATSGWSMLTPIGPKWTVQEQLKIRNNLEPQQIDIVLFR